MRVKDFYPSYLLFFSWHLLSLRISLLSVTSVVKMPAVGGKVCWETEWLLTTLSPLGAIAFVMFLLICLLNAPTRCLLHARHYAEYFTSINLVSPQPQVILFPFCRWGQWGTKRLSNLPKVIQVITRWGQDLYLGHLAPDSVPLTTESDYYGNSFVMKRLRNNMSYLYGRKYVCVCIKEFDCQWLNCPDLNFKNYSISDQLLVIKPDFFLLNH